MHFKIDGCHLVKYLFEIFWFSNFLWSQAKTENFYYLKKSNVDHDYVRLWHLLSMLTWPWPQSLNDLNITWWKIVESYFVPTTLALWQWPWWSYLILIVWRNVMRKMKCWMGIHLAMFGNFIFLSVLAGDSDVTFGPSKLSIYSFWNV